MSDTHLIVGPGALGRLLALYLAESVPVQLIGRRPLPAEQTLVTPEGASFTRRLACNLSDELPALAPAWVHLTTKAYSAEAAYAQVMARVPASTPLVLWQNGYEIQPRLDERHPGPVLCATTTEGAWLPGDGEVVHAGRGLTYIGGLGGRHASLTQRLAALLEGAGLRAQPVDDIDTRLWHKLAVNAAINPLVARFRIRNGQLRDRPFRPMVERVVDEIAALMTAARVTPPAVGWQALVWQVVQATAQNRASMLQDVLAGRPLEHEAILRPLLRLAERHRLATPALRELDAQLARLASTR